MTVRIGNVKLRTGRAAKPGHDLRVAERQQRALELRRSGASYPQIARTLDVSAMTAHRDVKASLAAIVRQRDEDASQLLALELERLDALWLAMWPGARVGDWRSANTLVRVSARRCALLGLDAPERHELTARAPVVVQAAPESALTDDALRARLSALLDALRTSPPPEPEPTERELTHDERREREYAEVLARRATSR